MTKIAIYFLIFFVVYFKGICSQTYDHVQQNEKTTDEKIVGGNDALIESYAYQCYLVLNDDRDDFECGGSILNEYYVLTAAHCLPRISSILVRIGSTNKFSGGYTYNTTTFGSHPLYNSRTYDYDVAIVTVSEGMYLDGYYARPITLVNVGNDPREGTNLVISGWGDTTESGTSSVTLKAAIVPVVSRTNCSQEISGVTSRMICAGYDQGGVDTCQGDSGGPAVLSSNGRLAGITSHGFGCARPNSPGVYTRVGAMAIRTYILAMTGI